MATLPTQNRISSGDPQNAAPIDDNFLALWTAVNGNLDHNNLDTDAVYTANIYDGAVTNAKIAAGTIQTDRLQDDAITQAKIAAGAVGPLEMSGLATSPTITDTFNGAIATSVTKTVLSKTITVPSGTTKYALVFATGLPRVENGSGSTDVGIRWGAGVAGSHPYYHERRGSLTELGLMERVTLSDGGRYISSNNSDNYKLPIRRNYLYIAEIVGDDSAKTITFDMWLAYNGIPSGQNLQWYSGTAGIVLLG